MEIERALQQLELLQKKLSPTTVRTAPFIWTP